MSKLGMAFSLTPALAALLPAQEVHVHDETGILCAAHDASRGRTVAIGYHGELREFDGVNWHTAAQPLFPALREARMVYDAGSRSTIACVTTADSGAIALLRYNGVSFQRMQTIGDPPQRDGFACAFDSTRGRLVLFGGADIANRNDTYESDGANWTLVTPVNQPIGRRDASMAYDSQRGRMVLFGGFHGTYAFQDTWEYDGVDWSQIATSSAPPARGSAAMTYDPVRGRTVLVGGDVSPSPIGSHFADTWEYDGVQWQQIQGLAPIEPRTSGVACFAAGPQEVLLLGGQSNNGQPLAGVRSFNGTRWTQPIAQPRPGVRAEAAIVAAPGGNGLLLIDGDTWLFDGHRWTQQPGINPPARILGSSCSSLTDVYIFGGYSIQNSSYQSDLWKRSGGTWAQVNGSGPAARDRSAMAYDQARGELVLFGGNDAAGELGDTWVFDGVAWTQRSPAHNPSARFRHTMAFDYQRNVTVLFGGTNSTFLLSDTYTWDGTDWTAVPTGQVTPSSTGGSMAFDAMAQRIVHVGGDIATRTMEFDGQRWSIHAAGPASLSSNVVGYPYPHGLLSYESGAVLSVSPRAATASHYGTSCGPTTLKLTATEYPRLGAGGFGLDVVAAPVNVFVALLGATQSVNVSVGGCTQLVMPGQLVLLAQTSASGFSSVALPLPYLPTFLGISLFFQAAALDAAAPHGFVLTEGLQLGLGI
jgi:hypothetical protein